jgi:hypothetical protein
VSFATRPKEDATAVKLFVNPSHARDPAGTSGWGDRSLLSNAACPQQVRDLAHSAGGLHLPRMVDWEEELPKRLLLRQGSAQYGRRGFFLQTIFLGLGRVVRQMFDWKALGPSAPLTCERR